MHPTVLNSLSLHTMMSCPFPDYLLFPVRIPPSRPSPCLVFFKLSPDSNPSPETIKEKRQSRHNAIKKFLIYECGFSPSEIPIIQNKDPSLFRIKSTHKMQQALELFRDSGFTPNQVRKTILRVPSILSHNPHSTVKDKIDFLKTLVFEQDVGCVVSKQPRILTCSIEQKLIPKIPLLVNLFGSIANVSKAIRKTPSILLCGFEIMEKKIRVMERSGIKEHEIKQILDKDPRFLASSSDKLRKNMVFLTDVAGFRPSIVVKYPRFLNHSVEKRLMPRHKVFEYLTTVGKDEDISLGLPMILMLSELEFEERILMDRPYLKRLFDNYMGKSVDLDIT